MLGGIYCKKDGIDTYAVNGISSITAAANRLGVALCEKEDQLHVISEISDIQGSLDLPGTKVIMKCGRDIGVIKGNGDLGTRSVPQEKAKNLLAHAEYVYENAIKGGGHDALLKHFKQSGIIKDVKYKDNDEEKGIVEKIDWNEERLQRSGYLMWGGGDENLDRTIKNYYYEITGSENPIVPVTGGRGRLSGYKTNVRKKTR